MKRDPIATTLRNPKYRPRIVQSKFVYSRKKPNFDKRKTNMKTEFPQTLDAVQNLERNEQIDRFAVGDTLLSELETQPGEHGRQDEIKRASVYLEIHGFSYNKDTLARFCDVSLSFPNARRHANVSWASHCSAGNPDNLDVICSALKGEKDKKGRPLKITDDRIRDIREKAYEEERQGAVDKGELPPRKEDVKVKSQKVGISLFTASMEVELDKAEEHLRKATEMAQERGSELEQVFKDTMLNTVIKLTEQARHLQEVLRTISSTKLSRLQVVGK